METATQRVEIPEEGSRRKCVRGEHCDCEEVRCLLFGSLGLQEHECWATRSCLARKLQIKPEGVSPLNLYRRIQADKDPHCSHLRHQTPQLRFRHILHKRKGELLSELEHLHRCDD